MPGLRADALQPGADGGIPGEVETAFVGDVRVRVERDVGDRVRVSDEKSALAEVLLHDVERCVTELLLLLEEGAPLVVQKVKLDPETRRGDVGLVAVLP